MKHLIVLLLSFPLNLSAQLCVISPQERFTDTVEEETIVLSPMLVVAESKVTKQPTEYVISKATIHAINRAIAGKRKVIDNSLHLPFADLSLVSPARETSFIEHIPFGTSFEKYYGGIKLSDNATFYFQTGVLWKPVSTDTFRVYFPYRYKSIVGLGIETEWENAVRFFFGHGKPVLQSSPQ